MERHPVPHALDKTWSQFLEDLIDTAVNTRSYNDLANLNERAAEFVNAVKGFPALQCLRDSLLELTPLQLRLLGNTRLGPGPDDLGPIDEIRQSLNEIVATINRAIMDTYWDHRDIETHRSEIDRRIDSITHLCRYVLGGPWTNTWNNNARIYGARKLAWTEASGSLFSNLVLGEVRKCRIAQVWDHELCVIPTDRPLGSYRNDLDPQISSSSLSSLSIHSYRFHFTASFLPSMPRRGPAPLRELRPVPVQKGRSKILHEVATLDVPSPENSRLRDNIWGHLNEVTPFKWTEMERQKAIDLVSGEEWNSAFEGIIAQVKAGNYSCLKDLAGAVSDFQDAIHKALTPRRVFEDLDLLTLDRTQGTPSVQRLRQSLLELGYDELVLLGKVAHTRGQVSGGDPSMVDEIRDRLRQLGRELNARHRLNGVSEAEEKERNRLRSRIYAQSSVSSASTNSTAASSVVSVASGTTSVPFFTIPNTFTPTATGESAIPGSVLTLTNGPYSSDQFTYTAAASTVPPTGNITNPNVPASQGGAGGNTALSPDPTNLQTAAARRNFGSRGETGSWIIGGTLGFAVVFAGTMTGVGLVL
ncbi:hypothetical protein JCM16303_004104 [Sporobolomyces ruberrimus]